MIGVVFDTNILISAAVFQRGHPFQCVTLASEGKAESITCAEILSEFRAKLIEKFDHPPEKADTIVETFKSFTRLVVIAGAVKEVEADPDDDKVIEYAVAGKAALIVSGDKHLLRLKQVRQVEIITAAEFVQRFKDE